MIEQYVHIQTISKHVAFWHSKGLNDMYKPDIKAHLLQTIHYCENVIIYTL